MTEQINWTDYNYPYITIHGPIDDLGYDDPKPISIHLENAVNERITRRVSIDVSRTIIKILKGDYDHYLSRFNSYGSCYIRHGAEIPKHLLNFYQPAPFPDVEDPTPAELEEVDRIIRWVISKL